MTQVSAFSCELDGRGQCHGWVGYPENQFLASILQHATFAICALFCIYLSFRMKTSIAILKRTGSDVLRVYYILIWIVCLLSVIIILLSVSIQRSERDSRIGQSVVALFSFFVLFIENSLLFFFLSSGGASATAADHPKTHRSFFRRTTKYSFVFSVVQTAIFIFTIIQSKADCIRGFLIAQQGYSALFVCCVSGVLAAIYAGFLVLPHTPYRHLVPAKKSYYLYMLFMFVTRAMWCAASIMMGSCVDAGLCLAGAQFFIFFGFFPLVVYFCFLSEYLNHSYGAFWTDVSSLASLSGTVSGSYVPLKQPAEPPSSPSRRAPAGNNKNTTVGSPYSHMVRSPSRSVTARSLGGFALSRNATPDSEQPAPLMYYQSPGKSSYYHTNRPGPGTDHDTNL